jgi:hemerythrin-like domain-containing protein
MPEGANTTTELQHEHGEIERLVQRIAVLEPCPERTELVHEATTRFLTHAKAEERYLFPAFGRYLPGGVDEVVGQQRQVSEVRDLAESMEGADGRGEDDDALVGRLVQEIQAHIERQDGVLLPQLLDVCPQEEVNNIGRKMRYGMSDERGEAD